MPKYANFYPGIYSFTNLVETGFKIPIMLLFKFDVTLVHELQTE